MAMLQNTPVLKSSHAGLNQTFAWAVDKALSYVQTGKSGPIDRGVKSSDRDEVEVEVKEDGGEEGLKSDDQEQQQQQEDKEKIVGDTDINDENSSIS